MLFVNVYEHPTSDQRKRSSDTTVVPYCGGFLQRKKEEEKREGREEGEEEKRREKDQWRIPCPGVAFVCLGEGEPSARRERTRR